MLKTMKNKILIFLFCHCILCTFGQTQVFKDYDFTSGDYSLYFIDLDVEIKRFESEDVILGEKYVSEDFYISDSSLLFDLKEKWTFEEVNYQYECGYDYFGYLTYKDSIISEIHINTECGELITSWGIYSVNENFLKKEIKSYNSLTRKTYRCDTEFECDSFIIEMKKNGNLVLKEEIRTQQIYDRILSKSFIELKLFFKE